MILFFNKICGIRLPYVPSNCSYFTGLLTPSHGSLSDICPTSAEGRANLRDAPTSIYLRSNQTRKICARVLIIFVIVAVLQNFHTMQSWQWWWWWWDGGGGIEISTTKTPQKGSHPSKSHPCDRQISPPPILTVIPCNATLRSIFQRGSWQQIHFPKRLFRHNKYLISFDLKAN